MKLGIPAGLSPACLLLSCLLLAAPGRIAAEAPEAFAWRSATDMTELLAHLEFWIDRNTDLPRRTEAPAIHFAARHDLAAMSRRSNAEGLRGLYDPATSVIWLSRPWSARDPLDVSVLLHEMIHHRQVGARHYYCPGAQELPAYRLQEAWLAALALELQVNWTAVVLEAGCTPRDIHPD